MSKYFSISLIILILTSSILLKGCHGTTLNTGDADKLGNIISRLDDPEWLVRASTAQRLMMMGPKARIASSRLMDIVKKDSSINVRIYALQAFIHLRPHINLAFPFLLDQCRSGEPLEIRWRSLRGIIQLGFNNTESDRYIVQMLNSPNHHIRLMTAISCSDIADPSNEIISELTNKLGDEYLDVQLASALALGKFRAEYEIVIPFLTGSLEKSMDYLSAYIGYQPMIIKSLEYYGEDAKPAVPVLIHILEKKQSPGYLFVPDALVAISPNESIAEVIASTLNLKYDSSLRINSANALGKIGHIAKGAIPLLVDMINDKNCAIVIEGALAIGDIGLPVDDVTLSKLCELAGSYWQYAFNSECCFLPDGILEYLCPAISSADLSESVGISAAYALYKIGYKPGASLPRLIDVVKVKDIGSYPRIILIRALRGIGNNPIVKSILFEMLNDRDSNVRIEAIIALSSFGKDAIEQAMPQLEDMIEQDPSFDVFLEARNAGGLLLRR